MPMSDALLPEFDHEMATTRKYLERVPEDRAGFKPHPKSMSLDRLAGHVAEIPMWTVMTMKQTSLDLTPKDGSGYSPTISAKPAELLATFDRCRDDARAAIAAAEDADFFVPWSLIAGGQTHFTMPRIAVLRGFVMSHLIHHRGQLSVYLRMNEVPVPSTYGPSADEGSM